MFLEVLLSDGKYFSSFQPLNIEKNGENKLFVTGSAIFEQKESGEVVMSIFRSNSRDDSLYYPQDSMQ